jgi:hypothetical protein
MVRINSGLNPSMISPKDWDGHGFYIKYVFLSHSTQTQFKHDSSRRTLFWVVHTYMCWWNHVYAKYPGVKIRSTAVSVCNAMPSG